MHVLSWDSDSRACIRAMARGYTLSFDHYAAIAETETFELTGRLATPDPDCTLLKLSRGAVTKGMSGAPVLELATGEVIGMLRTSLQLDSNLGGWVVPADVIRMLWPEEASRGNDRFHRQHAEQGGPLVGSIVADVAPVITGGSIGSIHIEDRWTVAADQRQVGLRSRQLEGGPPGPPGKDLISVTGDVPRPRYLKGQCPESIPVGKPFSLLASIVLAAGPSSAELKPFDVPPEGRDVLLVAHAPGPAAAWSISARPVHVPADGDSEPVMFELRADEPGPRPVSVTAWIGGSYLGELLVEITAEHDHSAWRAPGCPR